MNGIGVLILVCLLAGAGSVSAQTAWYGDWEYRVPITVGGLAGSDNILEIYASHIPLPDGHTYNELVPNNIIAVDGDTELAMAVEDWSNPNSPSIKSSGNLDLDDKIIIQLTANNQKTIYLYYSFVKEKTSGQELSRFYDADHCGWVWGGSGWTVDLGDVKYVKEFYIYDFDVKTSADWKLSQISFCEARTSCTPKDTGAPCSIVANTPTDSQSCSVESGVENCEIIYSVPYSPGDWFPFGCGGGYDAQNTWYFNAANRVIRIAGGNLGGDNGCPSSSYGNPEVRIAFVYNSWTEDDVTIGALELGVQPPTTTPPPETTPAPTTTPPPSTVEPEIACSDSDAEGGEDMTLYGTMENGSEYVTTIKVNYYEKGVTIGLPNFDTTQTVTNQDECYIVTRNPQDYYDTDYTTVFECNADENECALQEHSCYTWLDGRQTVSHSTVSCPYGCYDGACIKGEVEPETTPPPTTTPPPDAPSSFTVHGRLLDRETKEPLDGIKAYVNTESGRVTTYTDANGYFKYTYDGKPGLIHFVPSCNEQMVISFEKQTSGGYGAKYYERTCASVPKNFYSTNGFLGLGNIYLMPNTPVSIKSDIPVSFEIENRQDPNNCKSILWVGNINFKTSHYLNLAAIPGYYSRVMLETSDGEKFYSPWRKDSEWRGCNVLNVEYTNGKFVFGADTGVPPKTTPPPPLTALPLRTTYPPRAIYPPVTTYPPRPRTPEPPIYRETGSFIIQSEPEGAIVYVDENYIGRTPVYSVMVYEGEHTIKFEMEGYGDFLTERKLIAGESKLVSVLLKRDEMIKGTVSVASSPSGAKIYMDGDEMGVTPLIISDVSLSNHVIQLSKKGYRDYVTTLDVSSADTYTITADLTSEILDISNDEVSIQLYSVADVISLEENSEIILSAVSYIHNTEDMNLQIILKIPSGLAVSSATFAHAGGGQYTASSTVRPGEMRQISASILPTNLGEYEIEGELIYYFGDDKSSGDIRRIKIPLTVAEREDNEEEVIVIEGKAKGACGPTFISILSVLPLIIARRFKK